MVAGIIFDPDDRRAASVRLDLDGPGQSTDLFFALTRILFPQDMSW